MWKLQKYLTHKVEVLQLIFYKPFCQFSSGAQSCPILWDPMKCSTPGLPVHPNSRSSLKLTSIKSVMLSSHLILCRCLLLLPPVSPNIRVFSSESALSMRWPKYWRFSFNIARQHIKNQRHYFANKGLSSQSYGFSSGHVWMCELHHKESGEPKNGCL